MNAHIAIIDDDPLILELCQDFLESQDYTHTLINDSMEAFEIIKGNVPDLVITDIEMPNKSGLELLEEIKAEFPNLPVLVLSGRGTIQTAVQAIQLGADDYVSKPFHPQQFLLRIKTVLHKQELTVENEDLKKQLEVHKAGKSIIGNSRLMQKVFNVIERAAPTDANVLICGESGTGKEMVARELHNLSKRSKNPFIPVDCVAIPTHLIESELFGHEKGSFTGAIDRKIGLFETAKNGSIFLDEITELDIDLQSKLLRVLQERKFRRVGGNDYIDLNARIISATNRDPEQAVQENTFRLDLFYRLNVIPVDLPPLRERQDDILILINHFLKAFSIKNGREQPTFQKKALDTLMHYSWPGNVRELQNLMERLVILCIDDQVTFEDLPDNILSPTSSIEGVGSIQFNEALVDLKFKDAKQEIVTTFERQYLSALLKKHNGNISSAARHAGIDRRTIHRLINELDLPLRKNTVI